MKRFLSRRAMALALFLALVSPKAANATVINGFEVATGPNWGVVWSGAPFGQTYSTVTFPPYYNPIQGAAFLCALTSTAATQPTLSLSAGNYDNPIPANGNILSLCYASKDVVTYGVGITISDGTNSYTMYTPDLTPTNPPTGVNATDWHMLSVSLNYLRNLGMSVAGLNGGSGLIQIIPGFFAPSITNHISYDRLAVDEGASVSVPNTPTAKVGVSLNCGNTVVLTMPLVGANVGTNPIEGFHIYRAPNVAGPAPGTYASIGYVNVSSTTFSDTTALQGNTYWYIAMPYDSAAPSAPAAGAYLVAQQDSPGAVYFGTSGGPNEALVSAYSPAMALQVLVQTSTMPNPPTGLAVTAFCTTAISLGWNAGTVGAGGCNSVISYTVERTTDCVSAGVMTFVTGTASYVDSSVVSGNTYYYRVRSNDNIGQNSSYSLCVFATATGTACIPPPAPTATPVPVPGVAHIYPNPFHPDKGECFRVGNVPANTDMKVYDMVGALVYSRILPGNSTACEDNWDGFNNNGQQVVTGLYQLLLTFPDGTKTIYRVAVIRSH